MNLTPHIFANFIHQKPATEWKGNCPACGYDNAFWMRKTRRGQLQLHCFSGCDDADLCEAVNFLTGAHWTPPEALPPEDLAARQARKWELADRLWNESEALAGTIAETYLACRGIPHLVDSPALRFHGDVSHPSGGRLPAMVALVVDVSGSLTSVHRTYLASDGQGKADVDPRKASLGPVSGGVIRLAEPVAGKPLVLAEGIETAASAGLLLGLPSWSAISSGNLERALLLPPWVTDVIIAFDPDPPGIKAACVAGKRWRNERRRVRVTHPPASGDFNDMLLAKLKDAAND